jgi:hypothetical protein
LLRILTRQACEGVGVEPDRRAVDIAETPLIREHARDVVLRRPTPADDDLADALTRLGAFAHRVVHLRLIHEAGVDEQGAERFARMLRLARLGVRRGG